MEKSEYRRILRLQRQILRSIRADVRKSIGPQSADIERYYQHYKKEFAKNFKLSTTEELMHKIEGSDLILIGDYHTFKRSQQTALKILSELTSTPTQITLGLELFSSDKQELLDSLELKTFNEEKFLEQVDYEKLWGFPWKNYRDLILFALEHNIRLLGLNLNSSSLEERDQHAASLLTKHSIENPDQKTIVLYGDLHLADKHLPFQIRSQFKQKGVSKKTVVLFQNSETLYWKMSQIKIDPSRSFLANTVIKLKHNRFCIMNAPPWMKLQSFLDWSEAQTISTPTDDEETSTFLHEKTHDQIKRLSSALELESLQSFDFNLLSMDDIKNWKTLSNQMNRAESKAVKFMILANRPFFWPAQNLIYLPADSTNAVSEVSSLVVHQRLSQSDVVLSNPQTQFHQAILTNAISYFGSKVLNPKRKCDLEDDIRARLQKPLSNKALPEERLQRKSDKLTLVHLKNQLLFLKTGKATPSLHQRMKGPSSMALFLHTTRGIGFLLGEKMYRSFLEGKLNLSWIQNLYRTNYNSEKRAKLVFHETLFLLDVSGLQKNTQKDFF